MKHIQLEIATDARAPTMHGHRQTPYILQQTKRQNAKNGRRNNSLNDDHQHIQLWQLEVLNTHNLLILYYVVEKEKILTKYYNSAKTCRSQTFFLSNNLQIEVSEIQPVIKGDSKTQDLVDFICNIGNTDKEP